MRTQLTFGLLCLLCLLCPCVCLRGSNTGSCTRRWCVRRSDCRPYVLRVAAFLRERATVTVPAKEARTRETTLVIALLVGRRGAAAAPLVGARETKAVFGRPSAPSAPIPIRGAADASRARKPSASAGAGHAAAEQAVAQAQAALSTALAYGRQLQTDYRADERPAVQSLFKRTFSVVAYDNPLEAGGDVAELAGQEARAALAQGLHDVGEHLGTGAPECRWCPVCQVVHVVRQTSPEVRAHLASAAGSLMQAAAALMATAPPTTPPPSGRGPVEHIDLDDGTDPWGEQQEDHQR